MNDKEQLAAMGEHIAEQHQPMCMAKQIEQLQARLHKTTGLLKELRDGVEGELCLPGDLDERIDVLLAGQALEPELPIVSPDWTKAPEWARFWAVDFDGMANWFSQKPESFAGRWCYQQGRGRQHDIANKYAIDVKGMKRLGRESWWQSTLAAAPKLEVK